MGILNLFSRSRTNKLVKMPSGSFTLDRDGKVMSSTLPQSFPSEYIREIGDHVLTAFGKAKKAQMPLTELVVHYSTFKLLARELRGGAMIFLMPLNGGNAARTPNP
jgi:hypothetical protein